MKLYAFLCSLLICVPSYGTDCLPYTNIPPLPSPVPLIVNGPLPVTGSLTPDGPITVVTTGGALISTTDPTAPTFGGNVTWLDDEDETYIVNITIPPGTIIPGFLPVGIVTQVGEFNWTIVGWVFQDSTGTWGFVQTGVTMAGPGIPYFPAPVLPDSLFMPDFTAPPAPVPAPPVILPPLPAIPGTNPPPGYTPPPPIPPIPGGGFLPFPGPLPTNPPMNPTTPGDPEPVSPPPNYQGMCPPPPDGNGCPPLDYPSTPGGPILPA